MMSFLFGALLLFVGSVVAQDTSIVNPTTAAASATAIPSARGYAYAGCWNETVYVANSGGVRALNNGNFSANNTMTIDSCLDYCSTQYAGLEYGRECYCSPYLSALSDKLNESRCDYACNGNASQLCGGRLSLTLYNRTSDSKEGIAWSLGGQSTFYGLASAVFMVLAAFL
ncbi:hypothetical protein AC579_8802 [Pseudocercospora musae]|uniref:WSC domain-containing protein n=1 Tax=Pseudocercospora musae TaxID=113226 RepID=A0A139HAC6_9PEZI|nr:hypothetical protein AC579_8802 [Pseudocercospora musae]